MANNIDNRTHYKSLDDISNRKAELLKDIRKDQKEMGVLWNDIFQPERKSKKKGFNLQSMMSTSIGVLDGAIFAWKLYRKFKR